MDTTKTIAYFSMEIALHAGMPTYAGGLGVLAGDTIRTAASLHVPMVAVTLLHRKGNFRQTLDEEGRQHEEAEQWNIEEYLIERPERASVTIEKRRVHFRAFEYNVDVTNGFGVPVYFLDTDLPENSPRDRGLTDHLYGGDEYYRLCQEIVLGIGGVRILRSMGYGQISRFHLNEGHASLLTLELLDESAKQRGSPAINQVDVEAVRKLCVFTTHTPVASGHDKFPLDLVKRVLDRREIFDLKNVFCCDNLLNMTFLALNLSHYINGVAKRHGEISRLMFAKYTIDSITNGVHAPTWVAPALQSVFDIHIPGWREDSFSLRHALSIPKSEIWQAHVEAKAKLIQQVAEKTYIEMNPSVFTIGFARRATPYKRASLLLSDIERLKKINSHAGQIQIIYAGKAHPHDSAGKEIIHDIFQVMHALKDDIKIVYLQNYDVEIAKLMTAGVDLWLNTPQPPMEASGTSGMKAALNGVPSLSVLDGWWVEGCIEGVTGWAITDTASLFDKLEKTIVPIFYHQPDQFIDFMRHAIALNGSFFNTQRMLLQYITKAYFQ